MNFPMQEDNAHRLSWRSSDREPLVPQVQIPRALALDLIRLWCPWTFGAVMPDEQCAVGMHEARAKEHRETMEQLEDMLTIELSDQNITPSAENLLRVMSICYEAAPLIGSRGAACSQE